MGSLLNAGKGVWVDLADAAGVAPPPVTLAGMVELFGGGTAGKTALAKELASERGIKPESARRNIERYTTGATEKRNPNKELQRDLERIAQKRADIQGAPKVLERAQRENISVRFSGTIRISQDERERPPFTVTLTGEELAPFINEAKAHHWTEASYELNYAILNAWEEGRGRITGNNGLITDVDEIDIHFTQGKP